MQKEKWKKWIPFILCAVYAGCSLGYLLNLAALPAGFTNSAFSVPAMVILVPALLVPYREICGIEDKKQRKKRIVYVLGTGFLLGLSFVLGYQMRMLEMTSVGIKGKLFILVVSGGLSIAFSPLVNIWFRILDKHAAVPEKEAAAKTGFAPKKCFWGSWIAIFVCWFPVFLAYYPSIMSYDFHRQCLEASRGFAWFNSYQPLIHTFLIWLFLRLGAAIGSYEVGMAALTLLQMLILSAVLAYSVSMLGRLCRRKWPVVASCLLFGLLPVHPVLAMSMTKDILFSAFFLLLLLLMLERRFAFLNGAGRGKLILLDAAFVLAGILAVMFRNNAIYAIAVAAVFYVFWSSKERLKILLLCAAVLLGGAGAKAGIKAAFGAGSGSNVEMCSVIIQTVARAAKNQESGMTDIQRAKCSYIVGSWDNYNPPLADSLKHGVGLGPYQEWKDNPGLMLQFWAEIGLAYPNDYIDAVLALTSGYWFLDDVSHAEVLGYGDDTNLGLLYTFNASRNEVFDGVESRSFLPGLLKIYQHIVNGNAYYNWPGLSVLFKPALYCWALLLVMISFLYAKQYRKLVLCMLPFWYLMTLYLGPVVNMRYIYPLMVADPLLLGWLFSKKDWNRHEKVVEQV